MELEQAVAVGCFHPGQQFVRGLLPGTGPDTVLIETAVEVVQKRDDLIDLTVAGDPGQVRQGLAGIVR